MEVSKCWKIVDFPKIKIKMKNCRTFYEAQTASRLKEIIQNPPNRPPPPSPPPEKTLLRLSNKHFFTEIYRNIQTFAFKVLQECSSWESRNRVVQMFFSDTKQKHVCWKICKVKKVFGCVAGAYYFQCQVSWGS